MEKWVLFPNKFAALADVCAELHEAIAEEVGGFQMTNPTSRARGAFGRSFKIRKAMSVRAARLYGRCIQLALLTPVLAEAFLNLLILVTCKRSIKNNARQFDAFVRSHIDTKIFDLPYKCENFAKGIDAQSDSFKNFKRVMDKRNHAVHGNIDPEREQIETVYFEGKRPLFEKAGDHIGNFMASLERQYEPDVIVKDYEDVHLFLLDLLNCVEERQREGVLTILSDAYPGYDVGRKICGHLFPDYVVAGYFGGMRYDDELKINRK
jgi:hypothetical protein